jgi:tRNA nucleotidyltransferase (CCA-adding enzyme)
MNSTKIAYNIQKSLQELLESEPLVFLIAQSIHERKGRTFLVGGAVRDLLLEIQVKDLDIEVHGINVETLEKILSLYGTVSLVGKAYGVLRLHGLDIDWSVPRSDTSGRKPYVTLDPHMEFADAFMRRDLTMNAMALDILTYELYDPFNAQEDMRNNVLRTPNVERFVEDPLRFYRVMQFIGRFNMLPDAELNALCTTMDISTVSIERIEQEFNKLLLKSARPSLGIRWLHSIQRLAEILPELAATVGVKQEPEWHPEGDVFEHSMQALDAAVQNEYKDNKEKLVILYAALCHDLGKVTTTQYRQGRLRSFGHEQAGYTITHKMLPRILRNKELIDVVATLVRYHMMPLQLVKSNAGIVAYKRLAKKLAPGATLHMIALLASADRRGRNGKSHLPLTGQDELVTSFLLRSQQAQVLHQPEVPLLQGRDVMDIVQPGPAMGILLHAAYEIQLTEGITDKAILKDRVRKNIKIKK